MLAVCASTPNSVVQGTVNGAGIRTESQPSRVKRTTDVKQRYFLHLGRFRGIGCWDREEHLSIMKLIAFVGIEVDGSRNKALFAREM